MGQNRLHKVYFIFLLFGMTLFIFRYVPSIINLTLKAEVIKKNIGDVEKGTEEEEAGRSEDSDDSNDEKEDREFEDQGLLSIEILPIILNLKHHYSELKYYSIQKQNFTPPPESC